MAQERLSSLMMKIHRQQRHKDECDTLVDALLPLSPSVTRLQHLLHKCEVELAWLCQLILANLHVYVLDRVMLSVPRLLVQLAILYHGLLRSDLGVYLVKFRTVKCSLDAAERGFYRAFNSIFGKIGHIASEEVILQLVSTKCTPILLYGIEVLPIRQSQLRFLDFMINRLFMKLFKTNDIRLVHLCQDLFCFHLPSKLLQQRSNKFMDKLK